MSPVSAPRLREGVPTVLGLVNVFIPILSWFGHCC